MTLDTRKWDCRWVLKVYFFVNGKIHATQLSKHCFTLICAQVFYLWKSHEFFSWPRYFLLDTSTVLSLAFCIKIINTKQVSTCQSFLYCFTLNYHYRKPQMTLSTNSIDDLFIFKNLRIKYTLNATKYAEAEHIFPGKEGLINYAIFFSKY